MQRSAKVTLKFLTKAKRDRLTALLRRYRSAVNFFIDLLWRGEEPTYHALAGSLLSARFRSAALRQADGIVTAARNAPVAMGSVPGKPYFRGAAILDAKFVTIQEGNGHFDLAVKISGLVAHERITVLTKATTVLRRWLAVRGSSRSPHSTTVIAQCPGESKSTPNSE